MIVDAPRETRTPAAGLATRALAVRLFFTAWLIYALHAATNTVREIYPALSLGDHLSFRVDEYAGLHPDLFEKAGYGWHINSNPGASMLAALPYAALRPAIDRVVRRVNASRAGHQPPEYKSPWPMAREFFRQSWLRGFDVKFGLAALVIQALLMAPVSAAACVAMFRLLRRLLDRERTAFWLALLFAFGTPVFFRTGTLNHNLLLGQFAFIAFAALWLKNSAPRVAFAGLAAGTGVLLDYSGAVLAAALGLYVLARAPRRWFLFALGALPPIALLCFYQWRSFGHPFLPAQHWIQVQWVDVGYKGIAWPMADLLRANLLDYRYGLFVSCPLLLLAFAALLLGPRLPRLEFGMLFAVPVALWLFSSSVAYARLQFNTGVRYMVPAVPFLFVAAALTLARLPRRFAMLLGVAAVAQAWSMAMYRDVERGLGALDPLLNVFLGGFQLPLLSVLSRIGGPLAGYFPNGVSPLPLFFLAAAILFVLWRRPQTEHS
jgi:hypothetical protein